MILVGADLHEYLVFEAFPLIVDNDDISIRDVCEETCLLDGITPYVLKVQLIETSITIDKLSYVDAPRKLKKKASLFFVVGVERFFGPFSYNPRPGRPASIHSSSRPERPPRGAQ